MIDTVIDTLMNAHKAWGRGVYEDTPPNFTVMPCLSVSYIDEPCAAEGDGKSFAVFSHYIQVDIWMKKNSLSLSQRQKIKKDVINALLTLDCQVTIEAIRNIPEPANIHMIVEIFCIGGKEDDFR